jgi:hypothetical protein
MTVEGVVWPKRGRRRRNAAAALGPVGYLFGSGAAAQVLPIFLQHPDRRFTLGEILELSGRTKGMVQPSLRTLMDARLIRTEGKGNRTAYRYAAEEEIGRQMLRLIEASQRALPASAAGDIPWLEAMMREQPRNPIASPFGQRREDLPSTLGTEQILANAEMDEGAVLPRRRPGLRTRA